MTRMRIHLPAGRRGYALLSVTLFILVVLAAGSSFFALSSGETRQALYRQLSHEAFYLADGAIERARAKFIEDRAWRAGWGGVAAGRGTYDLTVADTVFIGHADCVRLVATGHVHNAHRRIEVIARVPPTALGLTALIMGDAYVNGNLCLEGSAHINGVIAGENHIQCDGSHTMGFTITPPAIFTDPVHFPDATYYYVKGTRVGGVYQARIFDAAMTDITALLGDNLASVTSYHVASATFTFSFDTAARIAHYFDDATGIFRRAAGDASVVVNFGEEPLYNPSLAVSAVVFDGSSGSTVHATIVNSRFIGAADSQRVDTNFWKGAIATVKQVTFEPYGGIAMITGDFQKQGGSQVRMGTPAWPAMVYVTKDVEAINSNFELYGSIICLGDWYNAGGPNITFDGGYIPNLPAYLYDDWQSGVTGTLKILRWRETTAAL
ncbi:MAG: hypothetical protein FJY75_07595 [Candidatus Eisenbacteria bacterium]|uniref:Type 4 fimbrial biogenesis protein PilX N-terminal domain-containing protein n=1 Tax=Eiseniibacteriota bacterium TaxID=2212470 RepID=A0A938BRC6_UNCEI|nr:hypothetical protein [Candidatus Eisenbacteria bacterium]